MSKKVKIIIAVLVVAGLSLGSFILLKPKKDQGLVEKEISIKQAQVPKIETMLYKDPAGFSFEYPSLFEVTEVEIDDDEVFSSLELTDSSESKIIVRVSDSVYDDTDEWQEMFEEMNVISEIEKVMFSDIPAIQFMSGAPILLKTVGVESKIIYLVESEADNGGFFDQAHKQVVDSVVFDDFVYGRAGEQESEETGNDEDVVLIEEILE